MYIALRKLEMPLIHPFDEWSPSTFDNLTEEEMNVQYELYKKQQAEMLIRIKKLVYGMCVKNECSLKNAVVCDSCSSNIQYLSEREIDTLERMERSVKRREGK